MSRADYSHGEESLRVTLRHDGDHTYTVHVGDRSHTVEAKALPDGRVRLTFEGKTYDVAGAPAGKSYQVRAKGRTWTLAPAKGRGAAAAEGGGLIEAPMTGTVARVLVAEGDEVALGDTIVVLTAMKMEHKLTAGIAGVVAELSAVEGKTVDQGTVLARVEAKD